MSTRKLARRKGSSLAFVLLIALLGVGCAQGEKEAEAPKTLTPKQVFAVARPATVALIGKVGDYPVGGSGVIIDARRGYVLTNAHVVEAVSSLKARVLDRTEVPARVIASSPCNDIAIVQLKRRPAGIKKIALADSDQASNQDEVVALGYPESIAEDEDQKIVSTSGEIQSPDVEAEPYPDLPKFPSLIQHSATINPGNSGGPLLNDRGQLIGINTLTFFGEEGEVQNQFYAIPTNEIEPLLPDLKAGRDITNPGWSIAPFSKVALSFWFEETGFGTAEEGEKADEFLAEQGVDGLFVFASSPGSPADKGKLEFGDLIMSVNDSSVTTVQEVCDILNSASEGETLRLRGLYLLSVGGEKFGEEWVTDVKL